MTVTTEEKVNRVRDYIAHTTGSENHWRHPLMRSFRYTDGVKFIADVCEAHWLIDLIASHQIKPRVRRQPFQVWYFEAPLRKRGTWLITCWTDTPKSSDCLARQKIEYTDFPAELLPLTLWVESGVLLLPAEH